MARNRSTQREPQPVRYDGHYGPPPVRHDRDTPIAPPPAPPKTRGAGLIALLSVITAVLTLATGYLGYQTAVVTRDKEKAQAAATQSGSQVGDLQTRVTTLQQDNDQLRSQLGLPPTSAGTRGADLAGTVRHTGRVDVVPGPSVDLDAPASDAKWGIGKGSGDIYLRKDGSIGSYVQTVYLGSRSADYATCSQDTTYRPKSIDRGLALPGANFCARTDEKRYSLVTIVSTGDEQATLEITTWESGEPTS